MDDDDGLRVGISCSEGSECTTYQSHISYWPILDIYLIYSYLLT